MLSCDFTNFFPLKISQSSQAKPSLYKVFRGTVFYITIHLDNRTTLKIRYEQFFVSNQQVDTVDTVTDFLIKFGNEQCSLSMKPCMYKE